MEWRLNPLTHIYNEPPSYLIEINIIFIYKRRYTLYRYLAIWHTPIPESITCNVIQWWQFHYCKAQASIIEINSAHILCGCVGVQYIKDKIGRNYKSRARIIKHAILDKKNSNTMVTHPVLFLTWNVIKWKKPEERCFINIVNNVLSTIKYIRKCLLK